MPKKAKFYSIKQHGQLNPYGPDIHADAKWVEQCDEGQLVETTRKVVRQMKTNPQLGYWYAVILPIALKSFLHAGNTSLRHTMYRGQKIPVAIDLDECDLFFKDRYKIEYKVKGQVSKEDMSDEDMSKLIDLAITFMAEYLRAECPPPRKEV